MKEFTPCDTDLDADVDGIDTLGFDYPMRCVLGRDPGQDERRDEEQHQ